MLSQPRLGRRIVVRFGRFGLVGLSGLAVNTVAMAVFTAGLSVHYLLAAVLATQVSTTWNFLGSELWAFNGSALGRSRRFLAFAAMNNAAFLARFPIIWLLKEGVGFPALLANLVSLLALTVLRFAVADSVIWRASSSIETAPTTSRLAQRLQRVELAAPREAIEPAPSRAELAAVAGLMGVALFFRVWLLMINGLNSDESVYAGQGAAMFGLEQFPRYFSLFRAHPLLMQGSVGVVYRLFGTSDVAARLVAVAFGMVAVAATWAAARELYGRRVGLYSLAFVAVLPYHALVSRQVLVDTPLGACVALAFFALARGVRRNRPTWIVGSAVLFGLAVLSKETAVIFVPIALVIVFFERRSGRLQKPNLLLWSAVGFGLAMAPFPLTRLVHSPKNAGAFFLWQFARDPNHTRDYFARSMLQFGTPLFVALVLAGVVMFVLRRSRTDVFLLLWAVPPFAFYTLWPTKLFPYLFPILPAMCIAAAVFVARVVDATRGLRSHVASSVAGLTLPVAVAGLMVSTSWTMITDSSSKAIAGYNDFDVEVQSFAGGREFGEWARTHTPPDATFLTIGPSLGNVLRFYGRRDSAALSVSIDPAKRNPAYVPVPNPDLTLRQLSVQFLVWDAYSADRTQFYSERLLRYVAAYGGIPVLSVYVDGDGQVRTGAGQVPPGGERRIIVYAVGGVAPVAESDRVPLQVAEP